jgi:serine protease
MVDIPGNYLDRVTSIEVTSVDRNYADSINSLEESKLYGFSLGGRSSFNLYLGSSSGDFGVELIQDKNANGLIDSGEVIGLSQNQGNAAEQINIGLDGGNYFIRVDSQTEMGGDFNLVVSASPFDYAGNSFDRAYNVGFENNSTYNYTDWVGGTDVDYYSFNLTTKSDFNARISGLATDVDLSLINAEGRVIGGSANSGNLDERIYGALEAGRYYLKVYPYSEASESFYNLSLSASTFSQDNNQNNNQLIPTDAATTPQTPVETPSTPSSGQALSRQAIDSNTFFVAGTLRADAFRLESTYYSTTVFSGNGNVDFGSAVANGEDFSNRDLLDLSNIAFSSARLNLADTNNGGVIFKLGNSTERVFDEITLSDGRKILFDGIETIKFSDRIINLNQSVIPNDPLFNEQWNLHIMGVQSAWRFTTGTNKIAIGIGDTGFGINSHGATHPDVRGGIYIDNAEDESPKFSHGTLLGGVIGATANNGVGIAGINWNSDMIYVDISGDNAGDRSLADATQVMINKANEKGQKLVVNLSIAGGNTPDFERLIAANKNKALFVIASGNGNQSQLSTPADLAAKYGNVISVGASWGTRDFDGKATTPGERISYDGWWGSNYGSGLTFLAPSEFVSTEATRENSASNFAFGYKSLFNGTSAAVPNVVGVASLVWSINPNLTAEQIRSILAETACDLGTPGYDTTSGYGLVNADKAIRRSMAVARRDSSLQST